MTRLPMIALLATTALVASGGASAPAAPAKRLTVAVRSSAFGAVLFDGSGRALYAFTKDGPKRSRCFGACAAAWPVAFTSGRPQAGSGVRAGLLGSIARRGGGRQVTYAGRPLYYYSGDGTGQIRCQNVDEFGGTWLVVRGSGALVR